MLLIELFSKSDTILMAEYPDEVLDFLKKFALDKYYDKFVENGVVQIDDMKVEQDELINDIGMTPEEAKRLLESLANKVRYFILSS